MINFNYLIIYLEKIKNFLQLYLEKIKNFLQIKKTSNKLDFYLIKISLFIVVGSVQLLFEEGLYVLSNHI